MSELKDNTLYEVTKIRQVKTKFGTKFVVELDNEVQVFLPNRMSKELEDNPKLYQELKENQESKKLHLQHLSDSKFQFFI